MDNIFYVYVLLDPRKEGKYIYGEYEFDFEPFYVGKGKKNRFLDHICECNIKRDTNKHKVNKIKKIKKDIGARVIGLEMFEGLSEDEAFELEKKLISLIGREDLGNGVLTNLTNGGDGSSGVVVSEEAKRKNSEAHKGEKNSLFGKHLSEETRKKMREAHKSQVPWSKGKKLSEEHKRKLSESRKGRVCWEIGKKHSEETKRKMSESRKKYLLFKKKDKSVKG